MNKHKIMILDDDESIRDILSSYLSENYTTIIAENAYTALELLEIYKIDLVLVDYNMPDMSGFDFINKALVNNPEIAYIMMTGNNNVETAIEALHLGFFDFIQKPFESLNSINSLVKSNLDKREAILEKKLHNEQLELMVKNRTKELENKNRELLQSRSKIIGILSTAAEFKDYETGRHFIRVSRYSGIIASGLKIDEDMVDIIEHAAPVHDIGKIGISEKILLKKGKLTDLEYAEMKKHCAYGEEILNCDSLGDLLVPSNNHSSDRNHSENLLEVASKIAKSHHESYDGKGYPQGLKGDGIPIEARIVAVADVYDALGTKRPYKEAWTELECQNYLLEKSGIQFDPNVVDAFLENIQKIMEVKAEFMDEVYNYSTCI